jgi:hypothetical protein
MSTPAEHSSENVLGAIVFFSYIVTALGLTWLILSDLSKAYGTFSRSKANTIHHSNLILVFASFAAISFSSLAYHMLNVLIYSYAQWAADKNVALPGSFIAALKGLTSESFHSSKTSPRSPAMTQSDFGGPSRHCSYPLDGTLSWRSKVSSTMPHQFWNHSDCRRHQARHP